MWVVVAALWASWAVTEGAEEAMEAVPADEKEEAERDWPGKCVTSGLRAVHWACSLHDAETSNARQAGQHSTAML